MGGLLVLANGLDRFAREVGKTVGWMMLPLIFIIMFDVVTRKIDFTRLLFATYTAESGISVSTILQDLQWHFHAILLMLTFGFGYLANAHVRVDVFRELLSKTKQAWIELVGLVLLGVPFVILMMVYSFDMVALSFHQGEGSESLTGIGQRWIIKSVMIIGFTVLMMSFIATIIRLCAYLFGSQFQQDEGSGGLEIFAGDAKELEEARRQAERALLEESARQ
ncbi:MAG: TRAP transporter small permease subunit [Alphaproteobacteria bacterium]|nr:TRAP transporter small permease subunit [Alphaproteobacteria bacterium]